MNKPPEQPKPEIPAEPLVSEVPIVTSTAVVVRPKPGGHEYEDVVDAEVVDEPDQTSFAVEPSRVRRSGATGAEEATEDRESPEDTPRFGNGGLSLSPISRSRPGAVREPGRNRTKATEKRRPLSAAEEATRNTTRVQGLFELTKEAETARSEYARLSAARATRSRFRGKNEEFGQEAVAEAKRQYKEKRAALRRRVETLGRHTGVSEEDLEKHDRQFAISEAKRLMDEVRTQRLVATGRFVINGAGKAEKKDPQYLKGKKAGAFSPRSKGEVYVNKLSEDLKEAVSMGYIDSLGSIIDAQTENEVYLNRRRLAGKAAVAAAVRPGGRLGRHYRQKAGDFADRWFPAD